MREIGAQHKMEGKEWNANLGKGHEKDIYIDKVKYACFVSGTRSRSDHWVFPGGIRIEDPFKAYQQAKKDKAYREFCEANYKRVQLKEIIGD